MAVEVQTVSSVQLISLPHISPSHTFSPLPLLPLTEPVSLLFPPPFSLSSLIFTILLIMSGLNPSFSPFQKFHYFCLYLPFALPRSFTIISIPQFSISLFYYVTLCTQLPSDSYSLCRSMEQKAAMIHLIRQSIGELRDTATTSGSNSPLPLPSPLHNPSPLAHPHNSHLSSYSPSHRHPLFPPSLSLTLPRPTSLLLTLPV